MKKYLIINKTVLFFLFVMLIHCQEVYYPDDLDSSLSIAVINGLIDNGPGPHEVTIYMASPYDEDSYEAIGGATVIISDDEGNSAVLTHSSYGKYYTAYGAITGVPGRSYQLYVEIDSTVYRSDAIQMRSSVYVEISGGRETIEETSTNSYGDLLVYETEGLQTYIDMNTESDTQIYLRSEVDITAQSFYYLACSSDNPVPVYCVRAGSIEQLINVTASTTNDNSQVIASMDNCFIEEDEGLPDSIPDDACSLTLQMYIVSTAVLSINKEAYDYYDAINEQLDAENRVFDPIASQIEGNIYCETNSSVPALGLFEVAGVDTINTAFYMEPTVVRYKELESYTIPDRDSCYEDEFPGFWVEAF